MTEHYVEVYPDEDYSYRILCSDPEACPGRQECLEDHTGYEPEDIDEYEDVMIHGVLHTEYVYGYGWAVPYPGCPVVEADCELPDGIPVDRPGKYLVDVDWDDTDCYLDLIKEVSE